MSIENLYNRLREDPDLITLEGKAFAFGFESASGRLIPIVANEYAEGLFRLSDAGETWAELVGEGFTDWAPSRADKHRLKSLAKQCGVQWEPRSGEFHVVAKLAGAPAAVRRLLRATIALDGWRVWASPEPQASPRAIVDRVVESAAAAGLLAERRKRFVGRESHHEWLCPVALTRAQAAPAAAVRFDSSLDVEQVVEHSIGWWLDTKAPSVVVTSETVALKLGNYSELRARGVRVCGRRGVETGEDVVGRAAELLATG